MRTAPRTITLRALMIWEWEIIAADAVVGAIAGALGWLAARRAAPTKNNSLTRIIPVVCVVTGYLVSGQTVNPVIRDWKMRRDLRNAGLALYGNERAADLHARAMAPILRNLRFNPRLSSFERLGRPGAAKLLAAGMARLEQSDREAIFNVKSVLAARSPTLCAGFWTGTIPSDELQRTLRTLDEEQQRIWITVSARALSREVDATSPPTHVPAKVAAGAFAALYAALTPVGRAAFDAADPAASKTDVNASCKAFLALADGMWALPPQQREIAMRSAEHPELIDR